MNTFGPAPSSAGEGLFGLSQRLPPANMEAEQALLGALLANNKAYERVSEFLAAEHFADPIHGRIYQAIQALETALEIEPGDYATLRGLGQLYEHAGFPCKAVEMWERAASVSPDEAARVSIKEHLLKLL